MMMFNKCMISLFDLWQYISFAWLFSPLHRMPLMFEAFIGFFWLFGEFVLNSTTCSIICANCGILNSPPFSFFFFNLQVTCHRDIVEISWNFFHNRLRTAKPCFSRLVLVPRFAYLSSDENWVCGCSNWDRGRTYWNLHLHSWIYWQNLTATCKSKSTWNSPSETLHTPS